MDGMTELKRSERTAFAGFMPTGGAFGDVGSSHPPKKCDVRHSNTFASYVRRGRYVTLFCPSGVWALFDRRASGGAIVLPVTGTSTVGRGPSRCGGATSISRRPGTAPGEDAHRPEFTGRNASRRVATARLLASLESQAQAALTSLARSRTGTTRGVRPRRSSSRSRWRWRRRRIRRTRHAFRAGRRCSACCPHAARRSCPAA